jgi:hypothetical protein
MHGDGTQLQTIASGANGEFNFTEIPPGAYLVSVNAQGFAPFTSAEFAVTIRQAYELADVSLCVATANTVVTVRPTDLIASEQIRAQEKQRLVGVIPNFYTSYIYVTLRRSLRSRNSRSLHGAHSIRLRWSASRLGPALSRPVTLSPDTGKAPRGMASVSPQSSSTDAAATS